MLLNDLLSLASSVAFHCVEPSQRRTVLQCVAERTLSFHFFDYFPIPIKPQRYCHSSFCLSWNFSYSGIFRYSESRSLMFLLTRVCTRSLSYRSCSASFIGLAIVRNSPRRPPSSSIWRSICMTRTMKVTLALRTCYIKSCLRLLGNDQHFVCVVSVTLALCREHTRIRVLTRLCDN